MGGSLTLVDIRLAMCLLRFDSSYFNGFGLDQKGRGGILIGDEFPNLRGFLRDVYSQIKSTVQWPAFRQYFRWARGLPEDKPLPDLRAIVASAEEHHSRV